MEKPCAAKVDIELGGVEKVINRNKSNQCMLLCFCATKNHHLNLQSFCAKNHPVNLQLYNLKSKDGSTWAGAWGKLTRLIPYMWPAKSASLQLRYKSASSGFAEIFNLDFSFDYQLVLFNSFDSLLFSELYFVYCSSLR